MDVFHSVGAARLQIRDDGRLLADALEVVDGEVDTSRGGDGQQVKDCVGRASESVHHDNGILHGLLCEDVKGLQVPLQQIAHDLRNLLAFLPLFGRNSWHRCAVGQRETHGLNRSGHGVGSVHTAAGTGAGAGMLDDILAGLLIDGASDVLAICLEGRDDVELLALAGSSRGDGTAVDHDGWPVDADHAHDAAGHILVTAGNGDETVVELRSHDCLDTVGDDFSGRKRVGHTCGSHGDAVGDANAVELQAVHVLILIDGLLDVLAERQQVHVAGVPLVPNGADSNLRFV
mmetsp:Transcript_50290/g.106879  ORF Transcript_50290/g.106879 Transcript_50290/m.106879 type:complete len:289 (+) Transcript_50290:799-1665(+)